MYEIKVLSRDEFDEVSRSDPRYSYVDESNFGFADRLKGKAYVLDTKVHDLNKYLVTHELEEMMEEDSAHEDPNGIRHKKGPKLFKQIVAPVLGLFGGSIGKAVSSATSMFGGENNSQPEAPQMPSMPSSGSFMPQNSQPVSGSYGATSPMNLFPTSGSYSPGNVPNSVSGSLGGNITSGLGAGNSELPPELLARLKGNYAGRIEF